MKPVSDCSKNPKCSSSPVVVLGLVLVFYITSYLIWSRAAFYTCRTDYGITKSFYYFPPDSGVSFRLETLVRVFYSPVHFLDKLLFSVPSPGSEPTKSFSDCFGQTGSV